MLAAAILVFSPAFPAAAQSVHIGAAVVPKSKVWAYILVGNSALSGRDPNRDTAIHPHAWKYVLYSQTPAIQYTFLPGREPLCQDARNSGGNGGPGLPFLKQMSLRFPDCYFVSLQRSGPAWTCKDQFLRGKPNYDSVIIPANRLKDSVTIAGIISMLGLVEVSGSLSSVESFAADIKTMVTQMRADLGMSELPYIHSGYPVLAQGSYAPTTANGVRMLEVQNQIPQTITNCVMIPTDSLTIYQDSYLSHYDRKGCEAWGTRVADSLVARRWAPGGAAIFRRPAPGRAFRASSPPIQKTFWSDDDFPSYKTGENRIILYTPDGKKVRTFRQSLHAKRHLPAGIYLMRSIP
jgi:hypothetical protein